ncbi:MAG: 50S ribosomal protein L6 [Holophagae bacterium]|jgi:large subunit ribosomal protein L6
MSRIGRKPITIPSGVDIRVDGKVVHVKGPKGVLEVELMDGIAAEVADGDVTLSRADEGRQTRAFHGLSRALLANAVTGVSEGWSKSLEIIGIGYRAERQGNAVVFNLGYSHPINFEIPDGIDIEVDGKANRVTVSGRDRQQVGQVAAEIRRLRPPEPYKGKGVRYLGERIRTKAGKQGATA